ncbi:tRNA (guanine-N1)-methyltransferase, partial [Candidatus Micrarchaeota archaeon]
MTLCIAVPKADAEKARQMLLAQHALDLTRHPTRDENYVYFPVSKKVKIKGAKLVKKKLKTRKQKPHSLREALQNKLTEKQLASLTRAFDVIGELAVIEIDSKLAKKAKLIGKALMQVHPNLKAVYMKAGKMKGEYRVRKLKHIAGAKRTITIHK